MIGVAYEAPLVEVVILDRRKRFLADVRWPDGTLATAHLANTGSMAGCWHPGALARVRDSGDPKRRLRYSVEQIQVEGEWIVVNTARANQVVAAGLAARAFDGLGWPGNGVRREVRLGESRVDFARVDGDLVRTWIEVKSVTLREGEWLRFPDAVSVRARRHVEALAKAVRAGAHAVLLFLVPREGGARVGLAAGIDPAYARAVREAVAEGVEVVAWRAWPSADGLCLGDRLPVALES